MLTPRWWHPKRPRCEIAKPGRPVVLLFLAFGWDADSPLRPWPTIGSEWRVGGRQTLVWLACCGVHLCIQVGGYRSGEHWNVQTTRVL